MKAQPYPQIRATRRVVCALGIIADPTSVACGDGFAPTPETASDSNQVGSIALKFTSISDPDCSTGGKGYAFAGTLDAMLPSPTGRGATVDADVSRQGLPPRHSLLRRLRPGPVPSRGASSRPRRRRSTAPAPARRIDGHRAGRPR